MIGIHIHAHAVEQAEADAHIGRSYSFPCQVVVAGLRNAQRTLTVIRIAAATNQTEIHIIVDAGITRCSITGLNFQFIQPIHICQEVFLLHVPHGTHRPEAGPAVVRSELRAAVAAETEIQVILLGIVVAAREEIRVKYTLRDTMRQVTNTHRRSLRQQQLTHIRMSGRIYTEIAALGNDGFLSSQQCNIVVINVELIFCRICISERIISLKSLLCRTRTTVIHIPHRSHQILPRISIVTQIIVKSIHSLLCTDSQPLNRC